MLWPLLRQRVGLQGLAAPLVPRALLSGSASGLAPVLEHLDASIGESLFSEMARKEFMSSKDYARWREVVEQRRPLDPDTAEAYATALRKWSLLRGASNWAHLWHPMGLNCRTGGLTRKFLKFTDENLKHVYELRGKDLLWGETDGSSFPTGGLRVTHRAGGYLSFDYTVDPYILDDTVFIPACFTSFNGHAIDEKTPLLRSIEAMNKAGSRLLRALGYETRGVSPEVGVEQEYFLIPFDLYEQRPDLILTGRTLLGSQANKGQQLSQHYMGEIRPSIRKVCIEFEEEMWKLGIEVNTRHTEVAPAQFEVAPVFSHSNRAFEENMVMMSVLSSVASRNGMACLLHEKPFTGINGSGKHNNYSFSTFEGDNLLNPGKNERENERFIVMLAACLRGFDIYADLIRASVAVPGNDFRLGACEAPPGIISVYTGEELHSHLKKVIKGGPLAGYGASKREVNVGIPTVAPLPMPVDDRNRTSPLPYGGNRFEFRAVGSSQSVAVVQAYMTTVIADSMDFLAAEIEKRVSRGAQPQEAAAEVVRKVLDQHSRIIFNGDGYSEEWKDEAVRRGLPNISNSVDAIKNLCDAKNVDLFERMNVLSAEELQARQNVLLEQYALTVEIEASTTLDMVRRFVIVSAFYQQERLASSIRAAEKAGVQFLELQREALKTLSSEMNTLLEVCGVLDAGLQSFEELTSPESQAEHSRDHLGPAMAKVRESADRLERLVDADLWRLPTYEQMINNTRLH